MVIIEPREKTWVILGRDLKYLEDGPLYTGRKEIVPALEVEAGTPDSALVDKRAPGVHGVHQTKSLRMLFGWIGGWLERTWSKRHSLMPQSEVTKKAVTIGIVTVLPEEYAAIECQLDDRFEYVAKDGRKNNAYLVGTMPAFGDEVHTVAASMTAMGNNSAAIRASALINDFPNLREVIMVGIAGAVPNPEDLETHVRLGDIVVSGEQGVIQYDFTKDSGDAKVEERHKPRPPSAELIRAHRRLEAEYIRGNRPWMDEFKRAPPTMRDSRPAEESDQLADSNNPLSFLDHPLDKARYPDEPRVFMGAIGAANKLLKDAKQRDQLRDKFGIRAIEMESSGVSDASDEYDIAYFTIRGTCDYCDINKNDDWHVYAATIAGAYCRALLLKTPSYRRLV
jgi:nucleoside phosphorylase